MLFESNVISQNQLTQGSLFHLDNVSVRFENFYALKSIQLDVHRGEILFITGESGAGKTTLMNVLAGEIKPDSGKVIRPADNKNFFMTRVFQDLRLLENLSLEDNLWVSFDKTKYIDKNDFYSLMQEVLKVLGALDRVHIKAKDANGGLKQKIAIARALLSKPTLLLADEPTCSMDKNNAMKVFDVVNYFNTKEKMTVVWSSHHRELVRNFPGRIAHLDHGKLVYTGHACFI